MKMWVMIDDSEEDSDEDEEDFSNIKLTDNYN